MATMEPPHRQYKDLSDEQLEQKIERYREDANRVEMMTIDWGTGDFNVMICDYLLQLQEEVEFRRR